MYFTSISAYWGNGTCSNTITYAEQNTNNGSIAFNVVAGGTDMIVSNVNRAYHNADGTKSIYIGASGSTNLVWGSISGLSQLVTLPTIPRAASITSSLSHTIGNNLAYTLSNPGSLYVKLVLYVWNGSSYTQVISSNRGTGASGTITLGSTENNLMYGAMPNNTSRAGILRAYTYSDSGYSTLVGSYYDRTGTIYIDQATNKPTFTTYTLENVDKTVDNDDKYSNTLVSSSTSTLLGTSSDKMIQGISKIRAVITTANKMTALNSATEDKYRFTSDGSYKEESYSGVATVNLDIDNASSGSVSVTAYDSRSLTTTVNDTFGYVAEYEDVNLWGLTLTRDNGVDSETKLAISGSYFDEYFGGGTSGVDNTFTCHYRYKETTDSWGAQTWTAITLTDTSGVLSFDDYINGDLGASGFDTEKSYDIEVRLYDKLTNVIVEGTLDRGTPVLDITQDGVAFGARYDSGEGGTLQILEKNILDIMYPVGSVYINASDSTNPATLLGFGTWAAFGAGRVPVGKASSGTFSTAGGTMGAETHTLTVAQMPTHNHSIKSQSGNYPSTDWTDAGFERSRTSNYTLTNGTNCVNAGSGNSHNNIQPSIVVYMWKRTA